MEWTHAGVVSEEPQPWEVTVQEQFGQDSLPWQEPKAGAVEKHEEEGAAEIKCNKLSLTHVTFPSALLGGDKVNELGKNLSV